MCSGISKSKIAGLDFRAADVYDAGTDLFRMALGALGDRERPPGSPPDAPAWWQGAVAIVTIDAGRVAGIAMHPVDLGVGIPLQKRGTPRLAGPDVGSA